MALKSTIKGIIVQLGGDTAGLQKSLKKADDSSKNLQRELNLVNKALKFDPKNATLLAQKQEILAEKVEAVREKLRLLKDMQGEVEKKAKSGDLGAEQYREYQREVETTQSILKNFEDQLKKTGDQFKEVQRKSGAVTFKNAEDKVEHFKGKVKDMVDSSLKSMEQLSEGFTKAGDNLEKVGSVVNKGSATAAAVLAGSVASFKDLDEGYDIIVKKTGATDEAFDDLKQTADELFGSSTFDMTDIGNAVGEINTRFGYTSDVLKNATEQYLQFAKINDADVSDSVAKTARIMQAWNLSSDKLPDLLGMITAKGQETGVAVGSLMDKVLDNNGVFKEMGLTLEDSISLMAQFEQNGVNDSTALAALKKSVKAAVDEEKPLGDVLRENTEKIKNAATDTEALQIATEVFGTKGAAEMANAIREGRINFDDLSGSMDGYKDTVKKTYDATVDPLEESKVVLNNLKLAGTELASEALKEGKPLLEDVVELVKKTTDWFKKLSPEQKKVLTKAIEIVAVAGPAVTIVGKINKGIGSTVGIIPKAVSVIKGMTTATKGAEAAQIGLNTAQSASPVGALITLLGLLAAAITTYYLTSEEARKNIVLLSDEENILHQRIEDNISAWEELEQASSDHSKEISNQYGYYEGLAERLDMIVESNGKIKEGYEDEANRIIPILNEAFGTEIKVTDGVITNYQNIQKELKNVILLQKAKAQQEVYSDDYNEALKNQTQAWQDLAEAQDNVNSINDEIHRKREKLARMKTGEWVQTSTGRQWVVDEKKQQEYEGLKIAIQWDNQKYKLAVEDVKKAKSQYLDYINMIKNYDDLTTAIVSEDYSEIGKSVNRLTHGFVTAENGTKEMLENQHKNFVKSLDEIRSAYEKGAPGVSQAMVEEAQTLVVQSKAELDKLAPMVEDEVKSTSERANKALDEEGQKATESAENTKKKVNAAASGVNIHAHYEGTAKKSTKALEDEAPNMENAGKQMSESAKRGAESVSTEDTGKNFISGFINGIRDKGLVSSLWDAAKNVGSTALNAIKNFLGIHSPSKESEKLGHYFGQGFSLGLSEEQRNAVKTASVFADSAQRELAKVNLQNTLSALSGLRSSRFGQASGGTVNKTVTTNNTPISVTINNPSLRSDADIKAMTDQISYELGRRILQNGRKWG